MSWEIRLPHRNVDAPVAEIAECARVLPEAERDVTRQLVLLLTVDHHADTVGDALDVVEAADPAARRALLDRARQRAGLPTTDEVDGHERFEAASHAARVAGAATSGWQLCHAPDCNAIPLNELGVPVATDVRRWFCTAHEHLAQPGDLEPRGSGVRLAPSGALVPVDEGEEARQAAESKSREQVYRERRAEREVEAAVHAEHDRRRDEAFRRELPPGVPG
jgi:hypothetical protein